YSPHSEASSYSPPSEAFSYSPPSEGLGVVSEELKAGFGVDFLLCWCILRLEKRNTRPLR
ncbi:MAG: hypothetical protein LBC74_13495, partial [Planctomycetaceae bacterium]|nr:hypothetical protein [Planctomycetaceae bacterium]